jgi:PAS domain S-box-containing protein
MFKHMKIGVRLGLGFAAMIALMVLLTMISQDNMAETQDKLDRIVRIHVVRFGLANGMMDKVQEVALVLRNMLLDKELEKRQADKARIPPLQNSYDESFKKLDELTPADDTKGRELIARIHAAQEAGRSVNNRVVELAVHGGRDGEALDMLNKEARPLALKWLHEVGELIEYQNERNTMRYEQAVAAHERAEKTMWGIGAAAIMLSLGLAFYTTRAITIPIGACVEAANRIAAGDIEVILDTSASNETGQLQKAMAQMVDAIGAMIRDVGILVDAAWRGRLTVRTDAAKHQGEYRRIIEGTNNVINRLVALLDAMPTTAMLIDSDFNILYMNEAGAKVGGKSQTQVLGSKCFEHFRTSDCQTDRCACGRAIRNGTVAYSETDAHPMGLDMDISYFGTPIRDEAGEIIAAFEVISDQTAVKQAARITAKVTGYQEVETRKLVACLNKLAKGDTNLSIEAEPADADTQTVKQVFDSIGSAIGRLIQTVTEITATAREIAEGNLLVKMDKRSEQDELIQALQDMVTTLREVATQAESISQGDYSVTVEPRSDRDTLGLALQRMGRALKAHRDHMQRQDWLKTGIARLNQVMSGDPDIATLAARVVSEISTYLKAQVAVIYVVQDEMDGALKLMGSYAYTRRKNLANLFKPGEGLVGQAALEKQQILIHNVPEDYIMVTSGLGEHIPGIICVSPFIYEDRVKGVVEVGTFCEMDDQQMEYLNQAMPVLAIAVESAEGRTRLARSLQDSQALTEELQAQQEELKTTNEELEEQASALKNSEEKLRVQQEELQVINEELEEKNDLLERQKREVELARKDIEQKAEELALASKYKSEFLSNMSHELRTPLNSLLLLAQGLAQNKNGNLTDEQVESAKIIHGGGSDLLNLINEILDLSKIEAGRMDLHLAKVPVSELADGIRTSFAHMAEEKDLNLEVIVDAEAPPEITNDRQRMEQVIRNLVANAIKFTEKGSVRVSFGRPAPSIDLSASGLSADECLAIAVKDTGIGIAPEQQKIIFEAFQQADGGATRQYGGTGLGLSIARELTRLLGGEIQLASEPGSGSTFTLYLPVLHSAKRKAAITASRTDGRMAQDPTRQRPAAIQIADDRDRLEENDRIILIIEDDANFARLLYKKCQEKGFKCLAAPTGEAGLELAQKYLPGAVILDIRLPGMDGWAVLSELKDNTRTRHIPVHIVSVEEASTKALRRGAIGHATKPLGLEDLEETFRRIEQVSTGTPRRLLVVEDDPKTRAETVKLIGNGDVTVDEAENGAEALEALRSVRYDCVVLDLVLPDMDGGELLARLDHEGVNLPPVIVYTARDLTRDEAANLRERADSIVIKDVRSQERLLDEVSLFLHRVVERMPEKKRKIIRDLHDTDEALRDKKVLIVDDDMRTAFALSRLLTDRGMQPLKAQNGERALQLLHEQEDTELVLMDIMMPVMDGYEAMRRIRGQEKFRSLPIIALTAKAMPEDRDRCLAAGASDYLTKPVDPGRLISMMRVWLYR